MQLRINLSGESWLCIALCTHSGWCMLILDWMLPMAMAQSSSDKVMHSQGEGAILGVFFPIHNALYGLYSGMNFVTKDRRGLNLPTVHQYGHSEHQIQRKAASRSPEVALGSGMIM